jgi:endonuclease YncB( thermonuclease family)
MNHRFALAPIFVASLGASLAFPLSAAISAQSQQAAAAPAAVAQAPAYPPGAPKELYEIDRVVDGDTLWLRVGATVEKCRLLSVDTEEKIAVGKSDSSKPGTVFGEECALWAQKFFADLAKPGETPRVGFLQPLGREQRDAYGRLLGHVILPDGTDFNLLLVKLGKSPYFNKYGNSTVCHAAFVAAQEEARTKQLGIWNPQTNVPKTPGAPSARRPYEKLIPWWQLRAEAIDEFRRKQESDADHFIDAEWPESLTRGAKACTGGNEVAVFGTLDRLFDEQNGDWTALLRSENKDRALRVRVPKEARERFAALDLPHVGDDFRQNYFWVCGQLRDTGRGFEMQCSDPTKWALARAEPAPVGADAK